MDPFVVIALLLIVSGVAFIYLLVGRGGFRRPADAVEWAGIGLSGMLVALAVVLLALALMEPIPQVSTAPAVPQTPYMSDADLNKEAENFAVQLVSDGGQAELDDYAGKVVLLNFWATWCAPCLQEMPELNRLQETYGQEGLVVLNVSDEDRQTLVDFSESTGMRTVMGYITGADDLPEPFRRNFGVRPTSYVIDRDGVIREFVLGALDYRGFERLVRPYLEDGAQSVAEAVPGRS